MTINFDIEMNEIADQLKGVEGYLDCEKIIIHNIKKHLSKGNTDENIIAFLRKQSAWFVKKITTNHNDDCTNYRFAGGFVDTLLKMPHWKNWMTTIDK